jgi:hypothetical protein
MSGKIVLVLLVAVIAQVLTQSELSGDKGVKCFDRECPSLTTACKKVVRTSEDKKSLSTVIYCMDAQDMVLKDFRQSVENPFGPHSTFESTSFSGTYTSNHGGHGGSMNVNINNNNIDDPNSLEDLS